MQRIISIWFLLLIFLPISSTYFSFKFRQYHIRKEIKHHITSGVSAEELVLLKIPVSLEENPTDDFKRMHAMEFRYKGIMYDVVKQENRQGSTWYWCLKDKQESALFASLDDMVNRAMRNSPAQQAAEEMLDQFLDSLYLTEDTHQLNHTLAKLSKPGAYSPEPGIINTTAPLTPPPQF